MRTARERRAGRASAGRAPASWGAAAALALVVLLLTSVAVSAKPAGRSAKSETVNLTLLSTTSAQASMDIMIANFNRVYPEIKINPVYQATPQMRTLLLTQLQANNAPDVFFVDLAASQAVGVWILAAADRLLDLSSSPWVKRIYPPAVAGASYKKKVYAWPTTIVTYDTLYNPALLKQLGLKLPTSFAQVLQLCKKITAAGKMPFVQTFSATRSAAIMSRMMMGKYVYSIDPKWDQKRAANQVTFSSSPLWRKMLQAFVDMKDSGCFQQGATGTTPPQQYALMTSAQGVFAVTTSLDIALMQQVNPNVNLKMFGFPSVNPKKPALWAEINVAMAGNAQTKYPKEVKTFINFLAREQQSTLFAKVASGVAPLDMKKQKLPAAMAPLLPVVQKGQIFGPNVGLGVWPNSRVYEEGLQAGFVGLMTGQSTIDSVLAKMDELWTS
jgi:raffinose/stachyose/melibiose transport system substrate-binding protein